MSITERMRETLPDVGLVALGGALGTLARYLLDGVIGVLTVANVAGVPVGILVINVLGAFALALLLEGLAPFGGDRWRATRLFAGTGFLGGFTTYSALAVGAAEVLGGGGQPSAITLAVAAGYAFATLVLGAVASWAGVAAAGSLHARRKRLAACETPAASGPAERPCDGEAIE